MAKYYVHVPKWSKNQENYIKNKKIPQKNIDLQKLAQNIVTNKRKNILFLFVTIQKCPNIMQMPLNG